MGGRAHGRHAWHRLELEDQADPPAAAAFTPLFLAVEGALRSVHDRHAEYHPDCIGGPTATVRERGQ